MRDFHVFEIFKQNPEYTRPVCADSLRELKGFRLAEIGVGYGGQLLILDRVSPPEVHELFDLPPVLVLASRYRDSHLLEGAYRTRTLNTCTCKEQYDLAVSNMHSRSWARRSSGSTLKTSCTEVIDRVQHQGAVFRRGKRWQTRAGSGLAALSRGAGTRHCKNAVVAPPPIPASVRTGQRDRNQEGGAWP